MKNYLIICLFLTQLRAHSQQFSSEVFHQGFLVTAHKDTLNGKLKYDLEVNIVTIIHQGKTKSFSSNNVFYFEIFDQILNNYRQFYSIPHHVNIDYKIPVFFEVVYEGRLSLLRRERIIIQMVNTTAAYWGGAGVRQRTIHYNYFFLDENGTITFFTGRKKDLIRFMRDKQNQVTHFIKQNKLDTNKMGDLIRITAFYNSI